MTDSAPNNTNKEISPIQEVVSEQAHSQTHASINTSDTGDSSLPSHPSETTSLPTSPPQQQMTSPAVTTLKEAFPGTDTEVIEAILETNQGNVERSFEDLLRISDPNYQAQPVSNTTNLPSRRTATTVEDMHEHEPTPPMPPRPQQQPITPEEQMRLDEEYAKQLALEDERQRVRDHQSRQRQLQQQQQQQSNEGPIDEFIKDLQEELPVIKEKVIEAGNAAKKKMMDWYNQVKANRMNNDDNTYSPSHGAGSSMPTSNAQYRGLPSDKDDDYLLSGDMTALHLSDHDVYAQTGAKGDQQAKNYYDYQGSNFNTNDTSIQSNVIHVHSPARSSSSAKQAQILADEEFARQLAQDDELWQRQQQRQREQKQQEDSTPAMPQRRNSSPLLNKQSPTVIVAPRSPLEEYDEQDNKDNVPWNASNKLDSAKKSDTKKDEDVSSRSYVIGDYDDSDDGLVDLDDEDEQDVLKDHQKSDGKKAELSEPSH